MLALIVAAALAAPNVVFLSVDTLRADRLGCYGYPLDTTPHIDTFAKGALVFDDCLAEVPLTAPSFGSMLTSRFPRMNGTMRNGLPLPASVPTVAEQFRAAGYQTFCVQSNWTLKAKLSGLERGFDVYEDHFSTKRWGVLKAERYGDEVSDVAIALLEKRDPNKPFFCWIHYSDPHAPYRFHDQFNPAGKRVTELDEVAQVRARYDSEVAYMDHHLARVLGKVPPENTYVLFVADHGESLHEHDYLGHGRRIYQTCVHVPLMILGPGVAPGHTGVPARGIDIGVTLLGLAGLAPARGMLGVDLIKKPPPMSRVRVFETYGGAVPKLPGAKALLRARPPMRQGVVEKGWKLILGGERPELFHLPDDPMEISNQAKSEPKRVANLKTLIRAWDTEVPKVAAGEAELTEQDFDALKSLGYIE
jgi:arylsulfatase A-like enzyme